MQPKADQVLPTSLEVPKDSNQDGGQGKEIETLKGKDKGQDKKKILLIPQREPQILLSLSPANCWPRGPQDESLG